ncbi:uncharacterized protein DUF4352 [Nocardiopsis sp. Huas11]|uniref:DUF4352 domain-containing protein n=1 Tax=Nocardiopsis sp. Huas11 TaxID=2183912 RepID=UPI000EAE4864|nr:DUF4352 domain-containing protein [Nocardiopsis sp. Huas11]RKS05949.1 uncharacterized protein DUF4352 [Nocardiopsis sp. Huas11]
MNKTSWIVTAAAAAMALMVGFGAGWFGNQAYLRAQLSSAFEDLNTDMADVAPDVPEDMEAMEEYEEDSDVIVSDNLPDPVAMGETASDGIWDITVTGVERADQVNGSYSNAVASDGWEFVILDVELVNASNGPQTPEIDGSEIMDAEGNRYAYHSDAAFALDDDDAMYSEVNPNGTATLRIPFEVEPGIEVATVLLSGTWDSPQVAVSEINEG